MKKVLSLLLVAFMLVGSLVACNSSTLEEDEKGAIIKMGISTLPDTFDPSAYALDADTAKIYSLVYSTLTVLDDEGNLTGSIAEKWGYEYDSIYEEHKMYFEMVESGWSDGRALSADEFVYAWKRILSPESFSPYAPMLYCIKNAKSVKSGDMTSDDLGLYAVDDTRIEVIFEEGYVNGNGEDVANQFAETVSCIAFAPLREDKVDNDPDFSNVVTVSSVLSCGPFFLRSYGNGVDTAERGMEFERNKYYMRNDEEDDALDISVIPYKIICELNGGTDANGQPVGELEQIAADYKAGDAYYLAEFTPDTYSSVSTSSTNSLSGYVYYFNLQNELFQNADVRRALSMAIDRNEIARIMGCGAVAATGFVPTGVFNTTSGTSFRSTGGNLYNTSASGDEAKALLKSAGVTSGSFTINYIVEQETGVNKAVADYVASVWNGLGFDVKVNGLNQIVANNNSEYVRNFIYDQLRNRKDCDVIAIDLSMSSSNALAYLAPFASGYSGSYVDIKNDEAVDTHFTKYNSEEYNAIIAEACATSDRAKRAKLLHDAEAILANDCPAIALVHYKNSYAASSKLPELEHYYNGAPNFNKVELEGWRDVNKKIEAEEAAEQAALNPETSK